MTYISPTGIAPGLLLQSGLYGVPDIERSDKGDIAVLPCFYGSRIVPAVLCGLPDRRVPMSYICWIFQLSKSVASSWAPRS